ncbi:hypothetical protein [Halovivax cerinus]|uniref:Uncharacterized protein n=1 Tax=Halovivax cerinus TaxID=1487865 RepID=A0ABD5NSL2_9EURY|nr:hypothetical protein [Halovivax cerinus]
MGMNETVTLDTELSAHEVAAGWPADAFTWINNVRRADGAVSVLLTDTVGPDPEPFAETLLDGFPAVERVAWTQLHNTSDGCVVEVYERAPEYVSEPTMRVLQVAAGTNYWRLARDAVREQCGIPVQTWYEIIDGDADIQTVPRDETPY